MPAEPVMREYETVYITKPEISDESLEKVTTRVKSVLESHGSKITKYVSWGKRKLAYEIAKLNRGIYFHVVYVCKPDVPKELERNLRLLDDVIRYLTVQLDDDVDPEAKPVESSTPVYVPAAEVKEEPPLRRPERDDGRRRHHDDEGEGLNSGLGGDDEGGGSGGDREER